jgi:hypothetical protein
MATPSNHDQLKREARVLFTEYILTINYYIDALFNDEVSASKELYTTLQNRAIALDEFVSKCSQYNYAQNFSERLIIYMNYVTNLILALKDKDEGRISAAKDGMKKECRSTAYFLSEINGKEICHNVILDRLLAQNEYLLNVISAHEEKNITAEERYFNEYYLATLAVADTISHGFSECKPVEHCEDFCCTIVWIIVFIVFIMVMFILLFCLKEPFKGYEHKMHPPCDYPLSMSPEM